MIADTPLYLLIIVYYAKTYREENITIIESTLMNKWAERLSVGATDFFYIVSLWPYRVPAKIYQLLAIFGRRFKGRRQRHQRYISPAYRWIAGVDMKWRVNGHFGLRFMFDFLIFCRGRYLRGARIADYGTRASSPIWYRHGCSHQYFVFLMKQFRAARRDGITASASKRI